jgi:hypothetical protein
MFVLLDPPLCTKIISLHQRTPVCDTCGQIGCSGAGAAAAASWSPRCDVESDGDAHTPTIISDVSRALMWRESCVVFLTQFLDKSAAKRRAAQELVGVDADSKFYEVMDKLVGEFCPPVPRPVSPASRHGTKVSVCHACAVCTLCACVTAVESAHAVICTHIHVVKRVGVEHITCLDQNLGSTVSHVAISLHNHTNKY